MGLILCFKVAAKLFYSFAFLLEKNPNENISILKIAKNFRILWLTFVRLFSEKE